MKGQRCLIIGSGISGIGAASLLWHMGAEIILYDSNESLTKEALQAKLPQGIVARCITGKLPG